MNKNFSENHTFDDESILARYQRAEAWEQQYLTDSMVLHAKVFPHWINDTH